MADADYKDNPIVKGINRVLEAEHQRESGHRNHLGGSLLGKPCERELFYTFRWAKKPVFQGRILRLFDRGHKEEFRFVGWLLKLAINVRPYSEQLWYHPESDSYFAAPWDTPNAIDPLCVDVTNDELHVKRADGMGVKLKQWRISDFDDHLGGSLDGLADGLDMPGIDITPDEEFLLEFKTHNTKSFVNLVRLKSVREAKFQHWAQMQTYMHKRGLKHALYMAINKNDDDLYVEIVDYDPVEAPLLLAKGGRVIQAKRLPNRIGSHPSWHDCSFCDFKKICHFNEPMATHCRTCQHVSPVAEGRWHCALYDNLIPQEFVPKGCPSHKMITD